MNRYSFFPPLTPVTKNLIIINVIIWIAMMVFPHQIGDKIDQYGALYYCESVLFNPAQLFTYMFIHSQNQLTHLFFNMFTLWMFGSAIEMAFGSRRFLFYYIACGLGAALIQEGVYALMINHARDFMPEDAWEVVRTEGPALLKSGRNWVDHYMGEANLLCNVPSVGASGAIYGLLLAFGMLYPNRPLFIMFLPIPVKAKYMVIAWGVIELGLGLGHFADNVAHFCHLGGMLAGLIMILYWKHKGSFHASPF